MACSCFQNFKDLTSKRKPCLFCKKAKWRLDTFTWSVHCLRSELSPWLRSYPDAWLIALRPKGPFLSVPGSWNDFLLCPSGVTNSLAKRDWPAALKEVWVVAGDFGHLSAHKWGKTFLFCALSTNGECCESAKELTGQVLCSVEWVCSVSLFSHPLETRFWTPTDVTAGVPKLSSKILVWQKVLLNPEPSVKSVSDLVHL